MNDADQEETVFILAPQGRDAQLAAQVLARAGIASHVCADADELSAAVGGSAGCALVTEEALRPAALATLRAGLARQAPWSDFPFLLFSAHGGDGGSWEQLARALGNVTLVQRPVHVRNLLSAVGAALRARRRQYEARQAIAQREQFLAMLGHELRNPLGAITFATELMDRQRDAQTVQRQRGIIERQARHLSRLVDDLLDVSRVTSGRVLLQRQAVDLNAAVERVAQVVTAMANAKSQLLTVELAPYPVIVDGDPVRLEQVMSNLFTNAVKYTPRGGSITISIAYAEGQASVRIADSGVGIEPAMLDNIFDLFAQAPRTLDRSEGGLGIGLTLVRRLLALHGGSVSATSAGVGCGSEFVVTLPSRSAPMLVSPEVAAVADEESPRTIVLVDDNADLRETLKELLESVGHAVAEAEDGPRGLARILTVRPDLAIVDIGLPGMDGYEVARQVRGALGPAMTLIALSGYSQPDDRQRSIEAGFDHHLAKPVTAAALLAMLRGPKRPLQAKDR